MVQVKQHHRKGVKSTIQTRARISTSMIVDQNENPGLWLRLYKNTVQRLKLLEEAHGKPTQYSDDGDQ